MSVFAKIAVVFFLLAGAAFAREEHVSKGLALLHLGALGQGWLPIQQGEVVLTRAGENWTSPIPFPAGGEYLVAVMGCADAGPMVISVLDEDNDVVATRLVEQGGLVPLTVTEATRGRLIVSTGHPSRAGETKYHFSFAVYARKQTRPQTVGLPL